MDNKNEREETKSNKFTEFMNKVERLAESYGWNVMCHEFEDKDTLRMMFEPAIGEDADNRAF